MAVRLIPFHIRTKSRFHKRDAMHIRSRMANPVIALCNCLIGLSRRLTHLTVHRCYHTGCNWGPEAIEEFRINQTSR